MSSASAICSKVNPSHSFKCTTARWSAGNSASAPASVGAKSLFVRIAGRREGRNDFGGELFAGLVARAAPADQINRRVVRQPDEKRAFVAHASQQFRVAGEFDENVLEQVARVGLVAGQVQEKGIKRLGVLVVEPFDFQSAGISPL
jgi:hypothetical protein